VATARGVGVGDGRLGATMVGDAILAAGSAGGTAVPAPAAAAAPGVAAGAGGGAIGTRSGAGNALASAGTVDTGAGADCWATVG
jgi:hypothetical protein